MECKPPFWKGSFIILTLPQSHRVMNQTETKCRNIFTQF